MIGNICLNPLLRRLYRMQKIFLVRIYFLQVLSQQPQSWQQDRPGVEPVWLFVG